MNTKTNSEHWKKLLPVITAFSEGREIQFRINPEDPWHPRQHAVETCAEEEFDYPPECYRVKPTPREFVIALTPGYSGAYEGAAYSSVKDAAEFCPDRAYVKVREIV